MTSRYASAALKPKSWLTVSRKRVARDWSTRSPRQTRKRFGINYGGTMKERTLTLALMDPPYESANSTTALRIISAAVDEEEHPTTKAFVSSLLAIGAEKPRLTWINCGLCVDERGAANAVDGVGRGSPADFYKMAAESTNTLIIPTK